MLEGLARVGHDVRLAPRDAPAPLAAWSEVVILAIPYAARRDAIAALGSALDGKILIDVTNPLGPGITWTLAPGAPSGAEELQAWVPRARVVKAFNTVFAASMPTGRVSGKQLSAFVAANDESARRVVLDLARELGFDAIDAGVLEHAHWLEALLYLEMILGFKQGLGGDIGWRLVRPQEP